MLTTMILLLCGFSMNTPAQYTSTLETTARFVAKDFKPDGDASKPAWKRAARVALSENDAPGKMPPEVQTEAAAVWSEKYLYFAFWCRYKSLNVFPAEDAARERWELWNRDVVEVFVNPFPERPNLYWEFEVAPNGQWIDLEINLERGRPGSNRSDADWNSRFDNAVRVDTATRTWFCEMRIPLSSMGVAQVKPGSLWRVNFYRGDGPGEGHPRRSLAWSSTLGRSFHVPARFGVLRLER